MRVQRSSNLPLPEIREGDLRARGHQPQTRTGTQTQTLPKGREVRR